MPFHWEVCFEFKLKSRFLAFPAETGMALTQLETRDTGTLHTLGGLTLHWSVD
jgi:hypothetical protein